MSMCVSQKIHFTHFEVFPPVLVESSDAVTPKSTTANGEKFVDTPHLFNMQRPQKTTKSVKMYFLTHAHRPGPQKPFQSES